MLSMWMLRDDRLLRLMFILLLVLLVVNEDDYGDHQVVFKLQDPNTAWRVFVFEPVLHNNTLAVAVPAPFIILDFRPVVD